ncbi:unnamed protein product, partial [Didymodactylos carnosus]
MIALLNVCTSNNNENETIFNQILNQEPVIVHENAGVSFTHFGTYFDAEDVFALSVSVPITHYMCTLLPAEESSKLNLCNEYEATVLEQINKKQRLLNAGGN